MLRDRLQEGLEREIEDLVVNGDRDNRLPNNLSVSIPYVDGEALLLSLDDVAVSSGSACRSSAPGGSHVMKAIGCDDDLARSTIRFGLGRWTTEEEINYAIGRVTETVARPLDVLPHVTWIAEPLPYSRETLTPDGSEFATVAVNPAGARRARRRHPWIYRSDLLVVPDRLENGAIVRVIDPAGRPLGCAGWSQESLISLRFVRWDEGAVDEAFWAARLEAALARRERAGMSGPARRIVFGEADEWPGLVVDQYGDCLSVQTLTPAADRWAPAWTRLLAERLAARAVVARNEVSVRRLEGLETGTHTWHGQPPSPFPVRIGDRRFVWTSSTGRRRARSSISRRTTGRPPLGGRRGARARRFRGRRRVRPSPGGRRRSRRRHRELEAAVERGRANAAAEAAGNIEWTVANAFDRLHELDAAGERFDAIVLDPPAFAKNKKSLPGARRGYKEINLRALKCLEAGGVLVRARAPIICRGRCCWRSSPRPRATRDARSSCSRSALRPRTTRSS